MKEIDEAAEWIATTIDEVHPIIPRLKERLGLSLRQACEAVKRAADMRLTGTQTEIYFGGSYDDALAAAVATKLSINDATAEGYYRSTGGAA